MAESNMTLTIADGVRGSLPAGMVDGAGEVLGGRIYVVGNGVVSSAVQLNGGDLMSIYLGGSAIRTSVRSGGSQVVGGSARETELYFGAIQEIVAGGVATTNRLFNSAGQYVYAGGLAEDTQLNYFASQIVGSGASANRTVIGELGYQHILDGGVAVGNTIASNGRQYIYTGGIARSTTISSGGTQYIADGGLADGTVISYGATQVLYAGGSTSNTVIQSGATQTVYGRAVIYGTVVNNGALLTVNDSALAISTTVNGGGSMYLTSGGSAEHIYLDNGGYVNSFYHVGAARGYVERMSGGVIIGKTLNLAVSGRMSLGVGGKAENTQLVAGGSMLVGSGATASNTRIEGSGTQFVGSGGRVSGTFISQGLQLVSGAATDTTVAAGGLQAIVSGGTALDTVLSSGGTQYVSRGGVADAVTVLQSGFQYIFADGVASNTVLDGPVASQSIMAGGSAVRTRLVNGAAQLVRGGAYAENTIVSAQTSQTVMADGIAGRTLLYSGGVLDVRSGASATGIMQQAGGMLNISAIAGDDRTVVDGSSVHGNFSMSGGIADNVVIYSGASLYVGTGGSAVNLHHSSGGIINVAVNGTELATYISGTNANGGFSLVRGVADNFIVYDGGMLNVGNGGRADNTSVESGGVLRFQGGASGSGTRVLYGGSAEYFQGAGLSGFNEFGGTVTVGGAVAVSGGAGAELVIDGRAASDGAIINGLSLLGGVVLSIRAAADQGNGTYALANGAGGFAADISIVVTGFGVAGVVSAGDENSRSVIYNGRKYTVAYAEAMTVTIADYTQSQPVELFTSGRLTSAAAVMSDVGVESGGPDKMYVSRGGLAERTAVGAGGILFVGASGTAADTGVGSGGMLVLSEAGAVVSGVSVDFGGTMIASGGAIFAGSAVVGGRFEVGGMVSFGGSELVFAIEDRSSADISIVTDLSFIDGAVLSVLVAEKQGFGDYRLADNAAGFGGSLTVRNGLGVELGYLAVGGTIVAEGARYGLAVSVGGTLSLQVSEFVQFNPVEIYNAGKFVRGASSVTGEYLTGVANVMYVSGGGLAVSTVVGAGGSQLVLDGGLVSGTRVVSGGLLQLGSGGRADATAVGAGGVAVFGSGAVIGGNISVAGLLRADGAVDGLNGSIELVLTNRSVGDGVLIENIGDFYNFTYSLTVDPDAATGVYSLASGADGFGGSFTIGDGVVDFGTISVGGTLTGGTRVYGLELKSGMLSLTVADYPGTNPVELYSSGALIRRGSALDGETLSAAANNSMYINNGGQASGTIIRGGGVQFLYGGQASGTQISSGGAQVLSGGSAFNAVVYSGGSQMIGSGAAAVDTVLSGGVLTIASGGVLRASAGVRLDGNINAAGSVVLDGAADVRQISFMLSERSASDGVILNHIDYVAGADLTVVVGAGQPEGFYSLAEGGFTERITVKNATGRGIGKFIDMDDFLVNGESVYTLTASGGVLGVRYSGYEQRYAVEMFTKGRRESFGQSLTGKTLDNNGSMYVSGSGAITDTVAGSGAALYLSGGTATDTAVLSGGLAKIGGGATLAGTFTAGGRIEVSGAVTVAAGGSVIFDLTGRAVGDIAIISDLSRISGGGYAVSIAANQLEGSYLLAEGASGYAGSVTVRNDLGDLIGDLAVAGSVVEGSARYSLILTSAGVLSLVKDEYRCSGVEVFSSGTLVSGGATVSGAEIVGGGNNSMYIGSGGTALLTRVLSGGVQSVFAGGETGSAMVGSGGMVIAQTGAAVTGANIGSGGILMLDGGAVLGGTTRLGGRIEAAGAVSGGSDGIEFALDFAVGGGEAARINDIAMFSEAVFCITVGDSVVNGDYRLAGNAGGFAGSLTVKSDLGRTVGALVVGESLIYGNNRYLLSVDSSSVLTLGVGGYAPGAQVELFETGRLVSSAMLMTGAEVGVGGSMYVGDGAVASATVVAGGSQTVFAGGMAADTVVTDGGRQFVKSGGEAAESLLGSGGVLTVSGGGVVNGGVVGAGAALVLAGGAVISGAVDIGGVVTVGGAVDAALAALTINLEGLAPGNSVVISDIGNIYGASWSITVNASQTNGVYQLADNAAGFTGVISLLTDAGRYIGGIAVGETREFFGAEYGLTLSGDTLVLSVSGELRTIPAKNDINANGVSEILLNDTGSGVVGAWMDGAPVWRQLGVAADGWEIAGAGDFTGDGRADLVLRSLSGGVVGIWEAGESADWKLLGGGLGRNWEIAGIGDFNRDGGADILLVNEVSGAVGVWRDGSSSKWSGAGLLGTGWEVAGCGDFSGGGQDDILLRDSVSGAVGVWRGDWSGAEPVWSWESLGSGATVDWEVAAIGDFNADGMDDLIWLNRLSGAVGAWMGGRESSWVSIGGIDVADWEIAAAGDYNGDGGDDVLLRQLSTGTVGYWAGADASKWVTVGSGPVSSWTIIA